MWDVKEPKHYSKRVGREVPGVVAVLCVVNTGPMLIAVTTITEMVILYKYVEIIIIIPKSRGPGSERSVPIKLSFSLRYSKKHLSRLKINIETEKNADLQ